MSNSFNGRGARVVVLFGVAAMLVVATSGAAQAALLPVTLPGNSSHDGWTSAGLDNVNNPASAGYPTSVGTHANAWPAPISSDVGGDGLFMKTSGGGYPVGPPGGIYTFITPGNFEAYDLSPVSDLATVVFQIDVGFEPPGGFSASPMLNYNGGNQALVPAISVPLSAFEFLYQWDLTSVAGPISDFEVEWGHGVHHQIFELRLDQSDVFTVVPEPHAVVLAAIAALGACAFARRVSSRKRVFEGSSR